MIKVIFVFSHLSYRHIIVPGWLQVCCSDAPFILHGCLYLDAVGRSAAVPYGGPSVQRHHSAPLLIPHWLWDTSCCRHYIRQY